MTPHSRQEWLEEEWFMVRHSGELPEIAFHSALYCLVEDPDGPRLCLATAEINSLRDAATARYLEILLRDLSFEQRQLTIYRGIKRAIFNWQRLADFCRRQGSVCDPFRESVAEAFLILLQKSIQQTGKADLAAVFNCKVDELIRFAGEMGIGGNHIPEEIRQLCSG